MDFIKLPLDKDSYNFAFVIIDQLAKKSLTIPCYKIIIAKDIAQLFLIY